MIILRIPGNLLERNEKSTFAASMKLLNKIYDRLLNRYEEVYGKLGKSSIPCSTIKVNIITHTKLLNLVVGKDVGRWAMALFDIGPSAVDYVPDNEFWFTNGLDENRIELGDYAGEKSYIKWEN